MLAAKPGTNPFFLTPACCAFAGLLATGGQDFGAQQAGPLKAAAPRPHSIAQSQYFSDNGGGARKRPTKATCKTATPRHD
jgi:hypothetical protein